MTLTKRYARAGGWCLAVALMLGAAATTGRAQTPGPGWRLVFSDDFARPTLGANWRWLYSSGRALVTGKALCATHQTIAMCVVPLPPGDTRAEFDLLLPTLPPAPAGRPVRTVALELRGGEWGDGGSDDRFTVVWAGRAHEGDPALDAEGRVLSAPDQPHHVVMQIAGTSGTVEVDGKPVVQKTVPTPRSEVNRYFTLQTNGMNYPPGKYVTLSNFRLYAGPQAAPRLPVRPNTPAENAQATRQAADFLDPANPGVGMQKAIDALPPAGGEVVLPAGEFTLRRQLRLRNGMTLRGQGAGKTILQAQSGEQGAIVKLEQGADDCVITLAAADAAKFRAGDGVCFDGNWGHPGFLDLVNKDGVVTAVAGSQVTVAGTAPTGAKVLCHWFPLIYAHCNEFVEVKDMTLVGGEGGWGGFMSSTITLGQTEGARVTRVQITKWLGDGMSFQTAGDALVSDNTVTNCYNGYHPGTTTQRFLFTRNLGLGHQNCGLYYCYDNRNGISYRNVIDRFDGYAWPDDSFDILAGNVCPGPKGMGIEQGMYGLIFNNRFEQIKAGMGQKGSPTYEFLVAANRADKFTYIEGDVQRNFFVGNFNRAGDQPLVPAEARPGNVVLPQGADLDLSAYPVGIDRTGPADPPVYPQPVLEGRAFYQPGKPDAGFQAALDKLGRTGGTLLLPAGRYALAQPLIVPSGVTLAGCGLGTVLGASRPEQTGSLVVVKPGARAVIRDLVILGSYERRAYRAPAISLQGVQQGEVTAVDVRGWEGTAVQATGGAVQVRDCRALGCAGNGYEFHQGQVSCVTNIARECAGGFALAQPGPGSRLEGNLAGNNRGCAYAVTQAHGLVLTANNASYSDEDGFRLTDCEQVDLVANLADMNNQSAGSGAAIHLAGATKNCRLYYNSCQDEQYMGPTQVQAIVEDATASGNLIRFNLVGKPARLVTNGQGSMVSDNAVQ